MDVVVARPEATEQLTLADDASLVKRRAQPQMPVHVEVAVVPDVEVVGPQRAKPAGADGVHALPVEISGDVDAEMRVLGVPRLVEPAADAVRTAEPVERPLPVGRNRGCEEAAVHRPQAELAVRARRDQSGAGGVTHRRPPG